MEKHPRHWQVKTNQDNCDNLRMRFDMEAKKKMKSSARTKKAKPEQKAVVKPILYKARGRYRIVDGPSQFMIEPSRQEVRTED